MNDIDHPIRNVSRRPMYEWLADVLRVDLTEIEAMWLDGQSSATYQPYERDSILIAVEMMDPVDRASFDERSPCGRIPVGFEQIPISYDSTKRCSTVGTYNVVEAPNGSPVIVWVLDGNIDLDVVVIGPDADAREQVLATLDMLVATSASNWRGQRILFDPTKHSWLQHLPPAQIPAVSLSDDLRDELRRNLVVPIRNFGLDARLAGRRGVLLHGRPGTGKTQAIEWVQTEVAEFATIIVATPAMFGSALPIKDLFLMARTATPSLVVMEDIDLTLISRAISPMGNDALGELLQFMDGPSKVNGAFVAATTNHIGVLDDALIRRPGRFDRKIEVSDATREARIQMATMLIDRIGAQGCTAEAIADRTDGWSLAELDEAAHLAVLTSLDIDEPVDLLGALDQVHRTEDGTPRPRKPTTGYV